MGLGWGRGGGEFEDAEDFGDGLWAVVGVVGCGDDDFGLGEGKMRGPVGDHAVGGIGEGLIVVAAVADDGVAGDGKGERAEAEEEGIFGGETGDAGDIGGKFSGGEIDGVENGGFYFGEEIDG